MTTNQPTLTYTPADFAKLAEFADRGLAVADLGTTDPTTAQLAHWTLESEGWVALAPSTVAKHKRAGFAPASATAGYRQTDPDRKAGGVYLWVLGA